MTSDVRNYYIEYYVNGRRIREQVGSNRGLAEQALNKRKLEIAENRFLDIKKELKVNFSVFADEYFESHSKVNNRSWNTFDKHNIKALKEYFGKKTLDEISSHLVAKFKAKRMQEVLPATVNRQLTCLKSIFNKAIAWGKFTGMNPVKAVKLFKENNQRLRFLDRKSTNCLIAVLAN